MIRRNINTSQDVNIIRNNYQTVQKNVLDDGKAVTKKQ